MILRTPPGGAPELAHYRALPFELRTHIMRQISDEAGRAEVALADFRDPTRIDTLSTAQNTGERRALLEIPGVARAALADDAPTHGTAYRVLSDSIYKSAGSEIAKKAALQLVAYGAKPRALDAGLTHMHEPLAHGASDAQRVQHIEHLSNVICADDQERGASFPPRNDAGIRRRRTALFSAAERVAKQITEPSARLAAVHVLSVAHSRTMSLTADEYPIRAIFDRVVALDDSPTIPGLVSIKNVHNNLQSPASRDTFLDHYMNHLPAWQNAGNFAEFLVAETTRRYLGESVNIFRRNALMQQFLILAGAPATAPAIRANAIRMVSECRPSAGVPPGAQQVERMAAVAQAQLLLAEGANHHSLAAYFTAHTSAPAAQAQDVAMLDAHLKALEHPQSARVLETAIPLILRLCEAIRAVPCSPAQRQRLRHVLLDCAKSSRVSDKQLESLFDARLVGGGFSRDTDAFHVLGKLDDILKTRSLFNAHANDMRPTDLALYNITAADDAKPGTRIEEMRYSTVTDMLHLIRKHPELAESAGEALATRSTELLAFPARESDARWEFLVSVCNALDKSSFASAESRNRLLTGLCDACSRSDAENLADDKKAVPHEMLNSWPDENTRVNVLRKMWSTYMRTEPAHIIGNADEIIQLLKVPNLLTSDERAATARTLANAIDACTDGTVEKLILYWNVFAECGHQVVCRDLALSGPMGDTLDRCNVLVHESTDPAVANILRPALDRLVAVNAEMHTSARNDALRKEYVESYRAGVVVLPEKRDLSSFL